MCCPLDQVHGRANIQDIEFDPTTNSVKLRGTLDRSPLTVSDHVFRFFQRLELTEKIAEIADESFHLVGSLLKEVTSVKVFQTLRGLHDAAHDIEHTLHAVCFLGDLSRLCTGRFFHDHHKKFIGYDYSAARVCHAVSHLFAFIQVLGEHKLLKVKRFEHILAYSKLFTALGFAIWTAALIWRRHKGEKNENFGADLAIHLGGFCFEAIPVAKLVSGMDEYVPYINKLSALAGIVHAWFVVDRLMPPDNEKFKIKLDRSKFPF